MTPLALLALLSLAGSITFATAGFLLGRSRTPTPPFPPSTAWPTVSPDVQTSPGDPLAVLPDAHDTSLAETLGRLENEYNLPWAAVVDEDGLVVVCTENGPALASSSAVLSLIGISRGSNPDYRCDRIGAMTSLGPVELAWFEVGGARLGLLVPATGSRDLRLLTGALSSTIFRTFQFGNSAGSIESCQQLAS